MSYWERRAKKELLKTEKRGEKVIDELVKLYKGSQRSIKGRIEAIFKRYADNGLMDKTRALELLNAEETAEYYDDVRRRIDTAKTLHEKRKLLNIYNSRAYGYRISRLMLMQEEIYMAIVQVKGMEEKITRKCYEDVIISRYKDKVESKMFTATTKQELKQILNEKWLGSNFSERIWKDEKKLTKALDEIVKVGFFTGRSSQDIAKELKERMDVSLYNATRLVRTESNYYHNQIDLRAYKDLGVKEYRYLAVLDKRTSETCRELDGEIFKVKDAKVGVNFPPMHPFCRSTTIRADVELKRRTARDKDDRNYKTASKTYKEYEKE